MRKYRKGTYGTNLNRYDTVKNRQNLLVSESLGIDDQVFTEVFTQMTPRLARVLVVRYGLDDGILRSMEETGNIIGITKFAASTQVQDARDQLARLLLGRLLKD